MKLEHRAYVLIETAVGRSSELVAALRQCRWIESVERPVGPYDAIAIAKGPSLCEIGERINDLTMQVPGTIRFVVAPISGPVPASKPDQRDPAPGLPFRALTSALRS